MDSKTNKSSKYNAPLIANSLIFCLSLIIVSLVIFLFSYSFSLGFLVILLLITFLIIFSNNSKRRRRII